MGDLPGHEFRGNQYTTGTSVKWSDEALRGARERASNYIRKYGERPEHRAYDEKLAKRGTIVGIAHAEKDQPNILRKKGDFIGYDVKFEGETGIHQVMPHMVEAVAGGESPEREVRLAEFHARTGSLDFAKEEAKASKMTDAELRFAREDARKAAEAMGRDNPKQGFYSDQGSVYAREQAKRFRGDAGEEKAVRKLESKGMTRSDAQAVREAEKIKARNGAPDLEHLSRENKIPANAAAIEHTPDRIHGYDKLDREARKVSGLTDEARAKIADRQKGWADTRAKVAARNERDAAAAPSRRRSRRG